MPVEAVPSGESLRPLSPIVYDEKREGFRRASLTAAPRTIDYVPGKKTEFWVYNDLIPGPQIKAWEGDTIEILFVNRLPQASTIHWHGMPVPPDQDGNPHDPVQPGKERLYRFTLPKGSSGTCWYHPHPHNDTPEQVFRGLAGTFIVRAKNDSLAALPEQHLLISDLKISEDGSIPANDMMDQMNGREGQFVLVNGQRQPVVSIPEPQRLRTWNACSARYLRLAVPGQTMTLIGTDGGLPEKPQRLSEIFLVPGERIEIVPSGGGQATLMALAHDRAKMGHVLPKVDLQLATLAFSSGSKAASAFPATLRSIVDPGPATAKKCIVFGEKTSMGKKWT